MSFAAKMAHSLAKRMRRARSKIYWAWRNMLSRARMSRELATRDKPISDLNRYERKIYSQHGEDGILEAIFRRIGITNKYCVEFGVGNGRECNSAYLVRRNGWAGLWMDGKPASKLKSPPSRLQFHQEFITAETINALFARYGVPRAFDLLSIDIDGNDYWIWKELAGYHPRVVAIEYNASVPPSEAKVMPYEPSFVWQKTDYYGASLLALKRLGRARGFVLVACDESGANAFFVAKELAEGAFAPRSICELYRPATYRGGGGHPPDPARKLVPAPEEENP